MLKLLGLHASSCRLRKENNMPTYLLNFNMTNQSSIPGVRIHSDTLKDLIQTHLTKNLVVIPDRQDNAIVVNMRNVATVIVTKVEE